ITIGGTYRCFGGPGIPVATLMAGWAPGAVPTAKDQEYARPIPRGSDLVVQIRYHHSGKAGAGSVFPRLEFFRPSKQGKDCGDHVQYEYQYPTWGFSLCGEDFHGDASRR